MARQTLPRQRFRSKCAGAPQKALYLSCDHWLRQGGLKNFDVELNLAGAVLFGVATFVPPLRKYAEKYHGRLVFNSTLMKVDGPSQTAWYKVNDAHPLQAIKFNLLHVVPTQVAPNFIRHSSLANANGWREVAAHSMQHVRYPQMFALGDACSTSNAKTAAVHKQVVVVAENLLALRKQQPFPQKYDGHALPADGGEGQGDTRRVMPVSYRRSFPLDPTVARRLACYLKAIFCRDLLEGHAQRSRVTNPYVQG